MTRYPQEMKDFIRANVKGRTTRELAALVSAEFAMDITEAQIKSLKSRYGLKSGTPLGAAGLIRSYGKAATLAVSAAGKVEKRLAQLIVFIIEYSMYNIVRNELDKLGLTVSSVAYSVDTEITVVVPDSEADFACGRVTEITAGAVLIERAGYAYIDTPYE